MDNAARMVACDSMLGAVGNERNMLRARLREVEHLLQDAKQEAVLQREGLLRERADALRRCEDKHEANIRARDSELAVLQRDRDATVATLNEVLRERDEARHECNATRRERDEARSICAALDQRIAHMQGQLAANGI